MVATFNWIEYLALETTTDTPTNFNFGSTIATDLNPETYPISVGNNSYEKYFKANFTGTFTSISDLRFYKSDGDYVTGEQIDFTGEATSYVIPVVTASTVATTTLPVADPGTANVSIGGNLAGTLVAPGTSDFIVLQNQIASYASSGSTNQKTFTFLYTET